MKYYIHPKRKSTFIQIKDGRTYRKKWVYFRTLLRTENDEKSWSEQVNSSVSQSMNVASPKEAQALHNWLDFEYLIIEWLLMLNFLRFLQLHVHQRNVLSAFQHFNNPHKNKEFA